MKLRVVGGTVTVSLSRRLVGPDVERIRAEVGALPSFAALELELAAAGAPDAREWAAVAALLRALPPGRSTVRGLTMEQSQLLLRNLGEAPPRAFA